MPRKKFTIFITSSWSEFLDLDLKKKEYTLWNKNDFYTKTVFNIIQPLAKFTIGMSPYGDREYDIIQLQKRNNKIIIIDDMDLSFLETNNTRYLPAINGELDFRELEIIGEELIRAR